MGIGADVKLSVSPNVTAHGNIAAHLLPGVNFGLSALGGSAKATIGLTLDASAGLDMTLNAGAIAAVGTGAKPSVGAGASGCVDFTTGLAVNAGADADLFSIFSKSANIALFQKNFDLFKVCMCPAT